MSTSAASGSLTASHSSISVTLSVRETCRVIGGRMQELDTQTFRLAVAQFDQAAEAMQLDDYLRERLKFPQRSLVVSVPVRMDDGHVEVFTGYRVQHDSSRGPSK